MREGKQEGRKTGRSSIDIGVSIELRPVFFVKFTARESDALSGQYYYRARYYGPDIGRFTSQDPMSFAVGDTNLYRYVNNKPTEATDPSGFAKVWIGSRPIEGSIFPEWSGLYIRHHIVFVQDDDGTITSYSFGPGGWEKNKPGDDQYTGIWWQVTDKQDIPAASVEAVFQELKNSNMRYNILGANCQASAMGLFILSIRYRGRRPVVPPPPRNRRGDPAEPHPVVVGAVGGEGAIPADYV